MTVPPKSVQLTPMILATPDLSYLDNPHRSNDQKAQKIVEVVLNQVKINSRVYPAFVFALEGAGPWTKTVVDELKQTLSSLQDSGKLNCEAHGSMQGYVA